MFASERPKHHRTPRPRRAWKRWAAIALAIPAAGCGLESGDGADSGYGPLAVIDDADTARGGGDDALGGTGPIGIDDECVTLENEVGGVLLLAWRDSEVDWSDGAIVFTGADEELRIEDGDVVTVGGSALEGDESDEAPAITWASEPDDRCDGQLWAVHSVTLG